MPVNHYFNNFSASTTSEQLLLEDLINESIRIYGTNVYYMPRELYDSMNTIYGEDVNSRFTKAYVIEMYVANVEGYEGDGDFFSKFGLEIRDNTNLIVARRAFEKWVPNIPRPTEGDLIFVPVLNKIFEIKFVEEELMFFSLGKRNPYIYELRCETFRYSNENISTGVEEVDLIEDLISYTEMLNLSSGSGNYILGETVYQGANLAYSTVSAKVSDWNPTDRLLKVINIKGLFVEGNTVIGATSNTSYSLGIDDVLGNYNINDITDNKEIQTEANTFIVTTEVNPLGSP